MRTQRKLTPFKFKGYPEYYKRMGFDRTHQLVDKPMASALVDMGYHFDTKPRSVYKVDKLYSSLDQYFNNHTRSIIKDGSYWAGVHYARKIFKRRSNERFIDTLCFDTDLVDHLSNDQASAGLTYYGKTKREVFDFALNKAFRIAKGDLAPEPCLAMARTQANDKTRLVWCYPATVNLLETVFARPVIDLFKTRPSTMHFGVSQRITSSSLRLASVRRRYAYSLDYSQFDSTISNELIIEAFKILSSWFIFNPDNNGINEAQVWNMIVNYFATSPIVMPDGNMHYGRRHGVPSGSYFTSIIDSIVNTMLVGMLSHRFNLDIKAEDVFILGDDCLIFTDHIFPLDEISEFLISKKFKLNAGKCSYGPSDKVHFLGRDWINGNPTADIQELVNKITQPESYRKYGDGKVNQGVKLVLKSYASVYHNFQELYYKSYSDSPFPVTLRTLEFINGKNKAESNHLSGLMRYYVKYFDVDQSSSILSTVWK